MKKGIFIAGFLCVGLLIMTASSHAAAIKEGQWSMTMVMGMEGMDDQMAQAQKEMDNMSPEDKAMMEQMMGGMGMKMGGPGAGMGMTTTTTQCITNDNPVPESPEEGCTQTHTMSGNTVHFEMDCPKGHSTGDVTYRNESMNGTIHSTTMENGVEQKVTINIKGEYVGACGQDLSESASKKVEAAAKKRVQVADDSDEDSSEESSDEPAPENTGKAKKVLGGIKALWGR